MRASPLVHIVDDDAAVRDALTMLIEQHGLAALPFDGAAAFFAAVEPAAMGCALVDVRMPEMDGMAMHAEMLRRGYAMPVLMLSGHGDIPMSVRAMKAGAINFLSKPVAAAVLVEALREAIGIDLQAHGPVATPAGSDDVRLDVLTPRERDVIRLALRGMANKEVARSLGISHRTVEIHKARAMQKLGVRSLLELRYLPGADGAGRCGAGAARARRQVHSCCRSLVRRRLIVAGLDCRPGSGSTVACTRSSSVRSGQGCERQLGC